MTISLTINHTACYAANLHAKSPAGRASCRKAANVAHDTTPMLELPITRTMNCRGVDLSDEQLAILDIYATRVNDRPLAAVAPDRAGRIYRTMAARKRLAVRFADEMKKSGYVTEYLEQTTIFSVTLPEDQAARLSLYA